jgi:pimeloyl-ACP methyl ester carboxylesterase
MRGTSLEIAKELHALLKNAGEKPPYVLVGHSYGGYIVRVFNGLYSDEVGGIVLVEATQEDQYELLPKAWNAISAALLKHNERLVLLCYKNGAPQKGQPESCRSRTRAMVCRSVAMDQGLCRSTRTGRTPRAELERHFGDG